MNSRNIVKHIVSAALLGSMTVGCATAPIASAPPMAVEAAPAMDYVLGTGDKIRFAVFGEASMAGEFQVASDGSVALPLVGALPAAGRTVGAFQQEATEALKKGYFIDPRVSVEVINFRPFYILGEVNKPGEYPYVAGLTLNKAVASANGYTYRANTKTVAIKRAKDETERKIAADGSLLIQPGDTVRVLERYF